MLSNSKAKQNVAKIIDNLALIICIMHKGLFYLTNTCSATSTYLTD